MELIGMVWGILVAVGAVMWVIKVLNFFSGTTEQARRPRSQSPEHHPARASETHPEC